LGKILSNLGILATTAPITAPTWIIGASTPAYNPLATQNCIKNSFPIPVLIVVKFMIFTPFKYAFISAIPPPVHAFNHIIQGTDATTA